MNAMVFPRTFFLVMALILVPHELCAQVPASSTQSNTPVQVSGLSEIGVGSQERAFLLDKGTNRVIALDTGTASILGTVSAEGGSITNMIQIPHSKRLAVFDRGPGKDALRYGWHPDGKASVSFVDMDSMKTISRLELGWGIGQVLVSDDGKGLAVVCPGYISQKPEETLPAEVVLISTETNQIRGRFPVKSPVHLLLTPDNRTLLAFTSARHYKDSSRTPEVQFVDFDTGKVLGKLSPSKAVTSAELSADGKYLYLLDPGEPSAKTEKNVNGALVVVSVPIRSELSATDVGSTPREFVHDDASDRIMILSDTAPAKKRDETAGALHVFKGSQAVAVTPVAHSPRLLAASPDHAVYYVTGADTVSIVDSSTLKNTGEIHVGAGLRDLAITPDGKRGIALFTGSDQMAILDLEQRTLLSTLKAGRASIKFMSAATAALNSASQELDNLRAGQDAQMEANLTGETQYYTVRHITPKATRYDVSIAVSPDSKFAYAILEQTYDLTIVDTQAGSVVTKIGLAHGMLRPIGLRVQVMPNGNAIAITADIWVIFIDTTTNQKVDFNGEDRLKVGSLGIDLKRLQDRYAGTVALELSPSGARALAFTNHRVVCLDTSTVKELGRQEDFKDLASIIFEKP